MTVNRGGGVAGAGAGPGGVLERLALGSLDMVGDDRFQEAIRMVDAANAEDSRTELLDGEARPRELLFATRVYDWVLRLVTDPSESLLLAARAHTVRRWRIPRDQYPKTTVGYHQWRDALAQFHAAQAAEILKTAGYGDDVIETVADLTTRKNFPGDADARTLEDADCLVFLETKLGDYLDEWDDRKTVNILARTLRKMTPEGRAQAFALALGAREQDLVRQAVQRNEHAEP